MVLVGAVCAASASASAAERAKNVILFVGDGMGVSTLTAARIYEAQQRGADGASNLLSFESFPNLALVRTYSANSLVTDSANGASALLTGHRTINGALGVTDKVRLGDCASAKGQSVPTLAEQAKQAGRATGVVSTAAITDATPASLYAHTPSRRWQSDADLPAEAKAAGCVDIARQMLDIPQGQQLDVMLGGGRSVFKDGRQDGRDLAAEWAKATGGAYVETGSALAALPKGQSRVLGLFADGNMLTESQRQAAKADAPTLTAMTTKAIELLSRDPDGYFLMVEGALIDKTHHQNRVRDALEETVEFSKAIAAAVAATDPEDTLIVVTADHSHGLTLNGGARDTSVLEVLPGSDAHPAQALDGKPIPILMYATGPGGPAKGEPRETPDPAKMGGFDHVATAAVPIPSAAHTGEDVAAYARGPGAERVRGLMDQPAVSQVIKQALGL